MSREPVCVTSKLHTACDRRSALFPCRRPRARTHRTPGPVTVRAGASRLFTKSVYTLFRVKSTADGDETGEMAGTRPSGMLPKEFECLPACCTPRATLSVGISTEAVHHTFGATAARIVVLGDHFPVGIDSWRSRRHTAARARRDGIHMARPRRLPHPDDRTGRRCGGKRCRRMTSRGTESRHGTIAPAPQIGRGDSTAGPKLLGARGTGPHGRRFHHRPTRREHPARMVTWHGIRGQPDVPGTAAHPLEQ